LNLLENAGKYADPGSPITIQARPSAGRVEVHVIDQEKGMPADEVSLIFESSGRKEWPEGTRGYGFGLVIAKRLVEANDGAIWARNCEGGGLDVGFYLPQFDAP
jgi:two-component system sensor histidine kinase KdpD